MQYANLSIEMALSRGGDQAVIRNKFTFEFYGGHSTETEKRTKVKSRVMANACPPWCPTPPACLSWAQVPG
mgnify:FL=1